MRAWESAFGPAEHHAFDHRKLRNDWQAVEAARDVRPDIMFYIGAQEGVGNPRPATFRELRSFAPLINLCSDAGDGPWHKTLDFYRSKECFDLQVSIDGAREAPVDLATLTPVDPGPFAGGGARDIRCGFSGSVGRWNPRSEIILALKWFGGLTVRERATGNDSYKDHAGFMRRCRLLLNISNTGTGHAHHIKGRVLEAGWAGCALLESEGSPIGEWFEEDCYIKYRDPPHAAHLIETLSGDAIDLAARRLAEEVRAKYTSSQIYGGILDRVRRAEPVQAA